VRLSIIVPVYNEEDTLEDAITKLRSVKFDDSIKTEYIIVDDGSIDSSPEIIDRIHGDNVYKLRLSKNSGKGSAVRAGIEHATGDFVIIYDADLEYDASEIPTLLNAAVEGGFDAVLGARVFGSHSAHSFWYVLGNRITTLFVNIIFNSYLSDIHTCYKLVNKDILDNINFKCNGFNFDTELVCNILKLGIRPYEIPISYKARSKLQGKKLTWLDGIYSLTTALGVRIGIL
jgi:glycosyltransferase involved in cell wall biosynthesis